MEPRCSARERVRWLSGEEFHPQPYEQFVASYAADGQHDEARAVVFAKERCQQRDRALLGRVWTFCRTSRLASATSRGRRPPGSLSCWPSAVSSTGRRVRLR